MEYIKNDYNKIREDREEAIVKYDELTRSYNHQSDLNKKEIIVQQKGIRDYITLLDIDLIDNLLSLKSEDRLNEKEKTFLKNLSANDRIELIKNFTNILETNGVEIKILHKTFTSTPLFNNNEKIIDQVLQNNQELKNAVPSQTVNNAVKAVKTKDIGLYSETLDSIILYIRNISNSSKLKLLSTGVIITLAIALLIYFLNKNGNIDQNITTSTIISSVPITNSISTSTKKPIIYKFTQLDMEIFAVLSLYAYYQKKVGCFMNKDSPFILLNNCSNWYGSSSNMFYCSCSTQENPNTTSKCDSLDECKRPYCIGNNKCNQYQAQIGNPVQCIPENPQNMYMCSNNKLGENGYTYYTYIDDSFLAIISDSLQISSENSTNTFNFIKYIPLILGIICIIFIFVIIIKIAFKHTIS